MWLVVSVCPCFAGTIGVGITTSNTHFCAPANQTTRSPAKSGANQTRTMDSEPGNARPGVATPRTGPGAPQRVFERDGEASHTPHHHHRLLCASSSHIYFAGIVRDATESDDEEGGRSPTRPSAELEADEELPPLEPHQMINPWYCPGKQFFLFKRWCAERNPYDAHPTLSSLHSSAVGDE